MTRIHILKKFDNLIGRLICCLPWRFGTQHLQSPVIRRILFIRPGGIGDAVLLVPTILAIQRNYPSALIDVLAERRNASVFSLCPAINDILLYENPLELLTVLRSGYDVVIDTEQWHHLSAIVARLTGAATIIGFSTNDRSRLLTHAVSYSHEDYEMESFFHLLSPLGIAQPLEATSAWLLVPPDTGKILGTLLGGLADKPFVAIFPSASIADRRWGAKNFGDLIRSLEKKGVQTVIVGGSGDSVLGEQVIEGTHGLNLAGKTSLAETAAVIARSVLLVSGDSGILHLGAGLGKPSVSLFGPGIVKKWAPRGDVHIVIDKSLPCSPCTKFGNTTKCPLNAPCLSRITVEEVLEAVENLLDRM